MQNIDNLINDKKFRIFKSLLSLDISNKYQIIEILKRQFNKITSFNTNLYLFKNDGSPLICFVKINNEVYHHLFSVDKKIKALIRNIKKDKCWYYDDYFGGYIRYTPAYAGVKIYNSLNSDTDEKDFYNKGFNDGINRLENSINSTEYMNGYFDGQDSLYSGNKGDDDEWHLAYDKGHNDGKNEIHKTDNSSKSNEYQNGYNIGYEHGKRKYKIVNEECFDISNSLCHPYSEN